MNEEILSTIPNSEWSFGLFTKWLKNKKGFSLNIWLDDRPRFLAGGSLATDLPQDALTLWDQEDTLIPETGEISVSQTWVCGTADSRFVAELASDWYSDEGYMLDPDYPYAND